MASAATCDQPTSNTAPVRPLANFPPNTWGDHFTSFSLDESAFEHYSKEVEVLKEEVKRILLDDIIESIDKMVNWINPLHRLGVSYLFEQEIESELEKKIAFLNLDNDKEYDLYTISVQFRVLRQHGYKIPCDVFDKFRDTATGRLNENLVNDVKGMLSLYEAAQLRIRGEDILDDAASFTTTYLKSIHANISPYLTKQVNQALRRPFYMGMPRLEARIHMSSYEEDEAHNELILTLAKMDFNLVQLKHKQELSHALKWWRDLECSIKAPYARDRVVETYFWVVGAYFEPQFSVARVILTKIASMTTIIYDTYDAYGTLEELQLFTNAINSWDRSAIDQLPEYMKFSYTVLLNLYDEIEKEMAKEGRSYSVYHSRETMKELVRSYYKEAEWFNCAYIPSFDEYMKNALKSCTYHLGSTSSFVGMGELATREAFEWIQKRPKILIASETYFRLRDDIVTHKYEQKRGHVASAVECYMKQYGVSEEQAVHELEEIISNAWKDLNEECLKPTEVSLHPLMRILNLSRVVNVIYTDEDGYTNGEVIKDFIMDLFASPVTIEESK